MLKRDKSQFSGVWPWLSFAWLPCVVWDQRPALRVSVHLRVDTTVVETNIHHPTDSSLLGDGVRVLIRTMKKIT